MKKIYFLAFIMAIIVGISVYMFASQLEEIIENEAAELSRPDKTKISQEVYDDIMGLGPLEQILSDPTITEVMVNGIDQAYIEKKGKIESVDLLFRDNDHLMTIIDRIVSSVGRHIDESSPMVDARLKDGSRVNVIIPPLSLSGRYLLFESFPRYLLPLTT